MGWWNQVKGLLDKDWRLWKRNLVWSLLRLCFPFVMMTLLLILKLSIRPAVIEAGPDFESQTLAIDTGQMGFETMDGIPNLGREYTFFFHELNPAGSHWVGIVSNGSDIGSRIS